MAVDRRQFLAAAGSAMAASAALSPSPADARMPGARPRTLLSDDKKAPAPPDLERAFQALLQWMSDAGWGDYLLRATGFELRAAIGADQGEIFKDLSAARAPEFADFGGLRAIQPGDPAMSLLYHALVSPEVRPATAVPLTDAELGFHPDSPAVVEHRADRKPGWDGEHGPFIIVEADDHGRSAFAVNYADMLLSDYVANATRGQFDLGRMRHLDRQRVLARMGALGRCIRRLPGLDRVRSTELWLVSAEEVADWGSGAAGFGVPRLLGLHGDDRRIAAAPGIGGAGWLYVFAREHGDSRPAAQQRRRLQPCRRLYVCQITSSAVRYAEFDARRHPRAEPRWR